MNKRHKVFISYHHELDEGYKKRFELRFGKPHGTIIPTGVELGDIDPSLRTETIREKIRDEYLRDASVTVVLVGKRTWQRKYVDWEISSTLHHTRLKQRGGLLAILLPAYRTAHSGGRRDKRDPHTIPPRLHDNVEAGYAKLYAWSEDASEVRTWIHEAYSRKSRVEPDNRRDLFGRNRTGSRWH
jgi:hypothetical protein